MSFSHYATATFPLLEISKLSLDSSKEWNGQTRIYSLIPTFIKALIMQVGHIRKFLNCLTQEWGK